MQLLFIWDMFMQMWYGNIVAWVAFILLVGVVGLVVLLIALWWKLPQPAKRMFLNNIVGHHPIIVDAYDHGEVVFETPEVFREGVTYSSPSSWHFLNRLTKNVGEELGQPEQDVITKRFHVRGGGWPLYLAYSGKATLSNPELLAVLEHAEVLGNEDLSNNPEAQATAKIIKQFEKENAKAKATLVKPDGQVQVARTLLIDILRQMKDPFITVKPVYISHLLDPRKIKHYIPKSYSKSQIVALEKRIWESLKKKFQSNLMKGVALLCVIILIVQIVGLLMDQGLLG